MFGFEDMSSGFHDVFLNKYNDTSAPIMDLYISDSMQDMLDIDIRSEVATVVGGVNEFSSLMNFELPSLELDTNSTDDENMWLGGPKWSAANDIYADVGACVNPNSVLPVITATTASLLKSPKQHFNLNTNMNSFNGTTLPSPKEKKSHLTFSPNTIKVPVVHENRKLSSLAQIQNVKKDLSDHMLKDDKVVIKNHFTSNHTTNITGVGGGKGSTIKIAAGIGGLTFANSMQFTKLKHNVKQITNLTQNNHLHQQSKRDSSPHRQNINNSTHLNGSAPKIFNRSIIVGTQNNSSTQNNKSSNNVISVHSPSNNSNSNLSSSNNVNNNNKMKPKPTGQEFPKPAYSYSCLIAMALKNSRSGSLPVSEIYSFMCEHFPYFKTAPNGWKNSVRHNLSLNKCFEKIEKPATNGGQRKGCLWAMNPSKIAKMDEEVQKWSRKDPMAIRKAMVYPEHLEALERGEMKHGHSGDSSDGENDAITDTEEHSDSEQDNEPDNESFIINTPESMEDPEDQDVDVDFDIEVADFYDEINIDSKEAFALQFVQKDLISLEDDDESMYMPPTVKRARLDVNYQITPTHQQQLQQQHHHNRRKTPLVNRIV